MNNFPNYWLLRCHFHFAEREKFGVGRCSSEQKGEQSWKNSEVGNADGDVIAVEVAKMVHEMGVEPEKG